MAKDKRSANELRRQWMREGMLVSGPMRNTDPKASMAAAIAARRAEMNVKLTTTRK